jgi:hypothetical protein
MSTLVRPSGPLPPRVYWVRRLLLLIVVLALLFWLSRLVGGDDDSAAASTSPTPPSAAVGGVTHPSPKPRAHREANGRQPGEHRPQHAPQGRGSDDRPSEDKTPLAEPDGPCEPADVALRPMVSAHYVAGDAVEIRLAMRTTGRSACTFSLGPDNLLVKITSGEDDIWTSAQCPQAVLPSEQVVRFAEPLTYRIAWSGTRSAPRCPLGTAPAEPGTYVVTAAVIGGEPAHSRFTLDPQPPTDRGDDNRKQEQPKGD